MNQRTYIRPIQEKITTKARKKTMEPQITQIYTDFLSCYNLSNPLNPWLNREEV